MARRFHFFFQIKLILAAGKKYMKSKTTSKIASNSKETSKDIENPAKEPEIAPPTVSKNSNIANTSEEDKMETD